MKISKSMLSTGNSSIAFAANGSDPDPSGLASVRQDKRSASTVIFHQPPLSRMRLACGLNSLGRLNVLVRFQNPSGLSSFGFINNSL